MVLALIMRTQFNRSARAAGVLGYALLLSVTLCFPASSAANPAGETEPQLIQPAELGKILQTQKGPKPLIFQVGFRTLYEQAHIPGSEYLGPTSEAAGLQQLRKRVEGLPRSQFIVLYCGCCPWSHCPNVRPAYQQLQDMGFRNVKLLYIANNFGADWVDRGYPTSKGK